MKLLALIPIVGIALALNAETVNDYVYQQPQKKIVKKGKKNATAKMGNNSIEIVPDKDAAEQADPAKAVEWIAAKPLKTPMVLLDGNRITYETLGKISSDEIASITVLKDQAAVDQYGEEARDGILLVTTKKGVKDVFVPVEQNPEFFDVVEQMPEYPGGPSALFEYLAKNIRYPESAEKAGIQGRVIATFVVMKDGSISNVKVVKSVSPELDTEALRVLSAMPNWTPGMQNGKAVNVKYTVPISFALPDSKIEETKESSVVVVKMK
jgi:TonB family protein